MTSFHTEPASQYSSKPVGRFLSRDECIALIGRLSSYARGGGTTAITLETQWSGSLRWGRNRITGSGDVRGNDLTVARTVRGARGVASFNMLDDTALEAAVRRAERLRYQAREDAEWTPEDATVEPYDTPTLWFDRTYRADAAARRVAMQAAVEPARRAGLISAGYVAVSAHGRAFMTDQGQTIYLPYTRAQCSITVRDPQGEGSGWAGVDWNDWGRVDPAALAATAIEKCIASRNPGAVEPGRYTVILEPQAVCDLVSPVFGSIRGQNNLLDLARTERNPGEMPFGNTLGNANATLGPKEITKLGQRVIDLRLTLGADPMDPDLGFVPVESPHRVFHPVTWITDGVLTALAYERPYAIQTRLQNTGLPHSGAFHLRGGANVVLTPLSEMIASTARGILVTRCWDTRLLEPAASTVVTGTTRDGLWLIERGKIAKSIKNLRFRESVLGMLNRVRDVSVAQRVFRHPEMPAVVPALAIEDFNFVAIADAI